MFNSLLQIQIPTPPPPRHLKSTLIHIVKPLEDVNVESFKGGEILVLRCLHSLRKDGSEVFDDGDITCFPVEHHYVEVLGLVVISDVADVLVDVRVLLVCIVVSKQSTIQNDWLIQLNLANKTSFLISILVNVFQRL